MASSDRTAPSQARAALSRPAARNWSRSYRATSTSH